MKSQGTKGITLLDPAGVGEGEASVVAEEVSGRAVGEGKLRPSSGKWSPGWRRGTPH